MPYPFNNSFVNDTIDDRLARLHRIEANQEQIFEMLPSLLPDLKDWIRHCHLHYQSLLHASGMGKDFSRNSTLRLSLIRQELANLVGYARKHVLSYYEHDAVRRSAFGLERALPRKAADVLALAERVLQVADEHKADDIAYRLPDSLHQRLSDAVATLYAEQAKRTGSKKNADSLHTEEDSCFDADTLLLRRLLASWQVNYGTQHDGIGIISMVNSRSGSKSGRPGVPVIELDAVARHIGIIPDEARPQATSCQLQFRLLGTKKWEEYEKSGQTSLIADARFVSGNAYELRVRVRNAHGYGKWSKAVTLTAE